MLSKEQNIAIWPHMRLDVYQSWLAVNHIRTLLIMIKNEIILYLLLMFTFSDRDESISDEKLLGVGGG